MKKLGLWTALAVSFIAVSSFAETITSVGAAYMTRANTTGADYNLKEKLDATAKFGTATATIRLELLRADVRVASKADPNGEWIGKLFLSVNDNVNHYYFNLTDRRIVALKSMKANEKLPNIIDITVDGESGQEIEYTVTLLPTPKEDLPNSSKVFHIIRLTDKSAVPTASSLSAAPAVTSAGQSSLGGARALSPSELPATRTGKKP